MIQNMEYSKEPIIIVQGDDVYIVLNFEIYNTTTELWENYDMTGKSIQMTVKNKNGTVIADWSTVTGELIINISELRIGADAISKCSCCGSYNGHIVELSPRLTLWKGNFKVVCSIVDV